MARVRWSALAALLVFASALACGAPHARSTRRVVRSERAPAPIGPYSQAIEANGVLYLAGQIGSAPQTGELVGPGVAEQTRQALANLCAVLEAAGSTPRDVVQATVYLTDLSDFAAMNREFEAVLGEARPARATVGVAALPRGAKVEIALIAVRERR